MTLIGSASPDPTPREPAPLTCSGKGIGWDIYIDPSHPKRAALRVEDILRMLSSPNADAAIEVFWDALIDIGMVYRYSGPCFRRGHAIPDDELEDDDACPSCGGPTEPWVPERPEGARE